MILFRIFSILCIGNSALFSERNTSHLLFDYTFLQTECENGVFSPNEFETSMSFGSLHTDKSIQCLDRSGYRSIGHSSGYGFESNSTIQSFVERIHYTHEFSLEAWMSFGNQYDVLAPILSFSVVNKDLCLNNASLSLEYIDNLLLVYTYNNNSKLSFRVNDGEELKYVHIVITFQLLSNGTLYQVKS